MKNLICFALIGLVFCVVLALIDNSAVAGNTYHVPDDYSTIQAAIDAASNGDTVLVADGTYTGSDNKDLDFDGKAITVKSENGPENCIIDCQDDGRAFYFHNDETNDSIVEGFTIKNGDTGIYYGAGIYCYDGASPTITNCIFEDNSTRRGGAIACKKNSSPTISNCIMKNNWALYGGGVWLYDDSDAIIKDCVITNNTADNNGGGIQSYDSNPTITNCLIADNEAISPGVGGGVYFYEGSVGTLTNCTIANNDGRYGGGVSAKDQGTTMTLNNTIIWGNHASTYGHQIRAYGYGAVVLNYCDYANGDNDVNTSSQGTVTPSNCINSDPDFVDDANGDYHLDTGSPCIDAGSNTLVPAGVEFDLAGNWRIIHDTVEIGAYEYGIFKDTASDRGIQGPSGGAENVVWADFNSDGYPDMYVTSSIGSNILYINDGPPDQTFTDATSANGVAGPTNSRGACAADYDNDGDVDLLVCNESGDLYLYRNNRVGLETNDFTEVAADAGLSGFSYSVMACWGDYDNDSYVDLYVVKSQGNCKLFQNDGDGTFTDVTSTAGVAGPSSGSSAVWCDIDGDNDLDLFVVGPVTASAKLYQNNADETFADITESAGAAVEGKSVSFGDIDNDGDFDFCVAVPGAANYLLKNNFIPDETLTFADIASSAGVSQPTNAVDCYFTDFNNDSNTDLVITADDGNTRLYGNNGDLTFTPMDSHAFDEVPQDARAWGGQELCDGQQNGYIVNSNGVSTFLEQLPNGNDWIVVYPMATESNFSAVGTRVELVYTVGETTQKITREITAGTGWGTQGSVGLHMGLGTISKEQIVSLTTTFPSGIEVVLSPDDFDPNQKIYIGEVDAKIEPDDGQRGVTGDTVKSIKGDPPAGEKHYVSPKKASSYVVLKAVVTPAGTDFGENFEWEGGEAVAGSPEKRKVSRGATGKTVVKLKYKRGRRAGQVADKMNVWIIWATFDTPTYVSTTASDIVNGDPDGAGPRPATDWRRPKSKCYRFVATISPSSIFDKTKDIPKLDGARTRPLPGADSGANKRWDISRRKREKILNPAPTTIVRNDYWAAAGDQKDNLDAKAAQFPIASIKLYEYPTDELEGNDDSGTTDEDNNPYSDAEGLPDNPSFKANKGQVASTDRVRSPYIREAAGNLNETVEDRTQFGEFVRLQIGDSSTAGYKNWYYISSHNNSKFLDWQAIIKFKRAAAGMIDNGSDVAINNNGW